MSISFADHVRVVESPITVELGLAGLIGQVYGETTPSVTGVEVIGVMSGDYAIGVHFEGKAEVVWLAPQLLEFVDHAPGTDIVIGNNRMVRNPAGEWIKVAHNQRTERKTPWWRFWG